MGSACPFMLLVLLRGDGYGAPNHGGPRCFGRGVLSCCVLSCFVNTGAKSEVVSNRNKSKMTTSGRCTRTAISSAHKSRTDLTSCYKLHRQNDLLRTHSTQDQDRSNVSLSEQLQAERSACKSESEACRQKHREDREFWKSESEAGRQEHLQGRERQEQRQDHGAILVHNGAGPTHHHCHHCVSVVDTFAVYVWTDKSSQQRRAGWVAGRSTGAIGHRDAKRQNICTRKGTGFSRANIRLVTRICECNRSEDRVATRRAIEPKPHRT